MTKALENQIKNAMGYSEKRNECGNCVYCNYDPFSKVATPCEPCRCMANKAVHFEIDPKRGCCDHFSAKRERRQKEPATAAPAPQSKSDDDDDNPVYVHPESPAPVQQFADEAAREAAKETGGKIAGNGSDKIPPGPE